MAKLDLQLATVSVQKELATVVARSLWDKKFTLDQVVKAITDKLGAHRTAVFTAALEWFKTKTVGYAYRLLCCYLFLTSPA